MSMSFISSASTILKRESVSTNSPSEPKERSDFESAMTLKKRSMVIGLNLELRVNNNSFKKSVNSSRIISAS